MLGLSYLSILELVEKHEAGPSDYKIKFSKPPQKNMNMKVAVLSQADNVRIAALVG